LYAPSAIPQQTNRSVPSGGYFAALWLVHLAGSPSAETRAACDLAGGSSGSPADLDHALSNKACRAFILGDGYSSSASIRRAGVTLRAGNRRQAHVEPELEVRADQVVVDGVSITSSGTALSVYSPGVQILNSCSHSDGDAGRIWDTTGGGTLGNILWRSKIWNAVNGAAIEAAAAAASSWDEIFWQTPPTGTTGAKGISLTTDPRFVDPPSGFTAHQRWRKARARVAVALRGSLCPSLSVSLSGVGPAACSSSAEALRAMMLLCSG
jgi:hypothetical protein